MRLPGFTAESSLAPPAGRCYRSTPVVDRCASSAVTLQLQLRGGLDIGAYWRCRLNGGSDLICRFFGGLPPFTIGGVLF